MKIPPEKLKPFSTEILPECSKLIASLKGAGIMAEFGTKLDSITEWCSVFGKTEMSRWADVLNECDIILEKATKQDEDEIMAIDRDVSMEMPLISVLRFTSLLFENTFSRSIYNSMEWLIKLLDSHKIWIVVQTLRLLLVISKSSRFISQHLGTEYRTEIHNKLTAILESWTGKLRSISFAEFCSENFILPENFHSIQIRPVMSSITHSYMIDMNKSYIETNKDLRNFINKSAIVIDKPERSYIFTKLRFAYGMRNQNERYYQVMARLISTSVIFYSRCLLGDDSRLNGLVSEHYIGQLCAVLHYKELSQKYQSMADAIKTESLKTLASIVFLEKAKKIQLICDFLELKTYHGFCPSLLRDCIERMKAGKLDATGECSVPFVTSLFSLIYHIAGFEYGGDALNRSSMISMLLSVVKTYNTLPEHYISFITRSVRIIDILTGMDVTEFTANDGTEVMVKRFTHEVEESKKHMETAKPSLCNQQRSALMKSLLNFLKRAVIDVNLGGQMRRIMETELPDSLIHIVDNPHFYGSSLLHCAITLATNFIYQEPAQLTMLQTKGLTDAIMRLIMNEKFPISRDLVCALPNVCSALCLNERGLNELKSFNGQKPLDRIFKMIYSNKFLLSMRKRKTEILETAHMLGTSFDEFIRHQPTLRRDVMSTISKTLDEWLLVLSNDKNIVSWTIGKFLVEEESTDYLPLGDFIAMLGVLLETMLTNRGIQDNVQMLNECAIPIRLVKLLAQAHKPAPILLQSNYLPNLANILCCVMRQANKVDEAFVHLVESSAQELNGYSSFKDDANERLYQATRLCSLIITLNNLMKSVIHGQSSYDIRPFLLHYFANDEKARNYLLSLFDIYKLMSSDKLLSAAQQTTSQILEDTTKVQELLIDDEISQQDAPMEVDSSSTASLRTDSQLRSHPSFSTSNDNNAGTSTMTAVQAEQSIQQVAYRCQKQISELIGCIGRNFCNASVIRVRQRVQSGALNQETIKKDFREMSKLIFTGMKRLLQYNSSDISVSPISQSLNLLKKLLTDDAQNIIYLLPYFYLSNCHQSFFNLAESCFQSNFSKDEYIAALHSWLIIAQKLVSTNLLSIDAKHNRNGTQNKLSVEGFELKSYLATSQKANFAALLSLFKALVVQCELSAKLPNPVERKEAKEDGCYVLLKKLLESLKFVLGDMLKLLEMIEGKNEATQEIPVNEIDPNKIQQLVEMGFSQSESVDALLQNSSVPEAAEYLVSLMERTTNQPTTTAPLMPTAIVAAVQNISSILSEEIMPEEQQATSSITSNSDKKNLFAELKPWERGELQERVELVCNEIVGSCIKLISRDRSVVIGLSELITVFVEDPLARSWVDGEFIGRLINELNSQLDIVGGKEDDNNQGGHLAALLHLFCLLWQNFPDMNIHKRLGTRDNGTSSAEDLSMGLRQ